MRRTWRRRIGNRCVLPAALARLLSADAMLQAVEMDPLAQLVDLLAVPDVAARTFDWDTVSARIGTAVPVDYQRLCDRWGGTCLDGELSIEAPADDDRAGLVGFVRWKLAVDRDLREDGVWDGRLWPEPGGLLPWAWLENGTSVWWQTAGEPDAWTVVLKRDDELAKDCGHVTQTGLRSTAFVADRLARSTHRRPLQVKTIEPCGTRWLPSGDAEAVDMGEKREGERWRLFLNLGDVLDEPRTIVLQGFLHDLDAQHPRLRGSIVDTRVRHACEELVVVGSWRGQRRCRLLGEAAIRYAERRLERPMDYGP